MGRRSGWGAVLLLAATACGSSSSPTVAADAAPTSTAAPSTSTTATTASPATTAVATATPPTEPPTTAAPAPTAPPRRFVAQNGFIPMTVAGPVMLFHPAAFVERVGFHESTHDGAQQQEALATTVAPTVLETRDRGTGSQTAADVVVDPDAEIRAPVTGTVIRGGTYTLYCDHSDEYLVIEPDDRPGWEVKVLHVVGLAVRTGDHVVAGETVVAAHAHVLPFPSQVDDLRPADPAWPHVHVEVVDPTVPDRPTGPGCS